MKQITLTTDFGTRDGYAGTMKGVIWMVAPDAAITDITHDISPQNILEGALTLKRTLQYFPAGCVHIAVVDPGVGTQRRPIAARLGDHFLVGPDNGLFWLHIQNGINAGQSFEAVHLNQSEYWLDPVSHSFHGRDIFAPVGAHLANGVPLHRLGSPIHDLVQLHFPAPQPTKTGWHGEIIHADTFGNLATNIARSHIPPHAHVSVHIAGQTISGISNAYGDRKPGEFAAIFDSDELLSLAVVNGSAARQLNAATGTPVEIIFELPQKGSA